jgi:hypothetical protein
VGWLDRIATASFKKDAEGRNLFFPWGKLGPGRVVPSEADSAWIRSYLKIYFVCVVVTAVPVIVIGKIFRTSADLTTGALFIGAFVVVLIIPWFVLWLRVRSWLVAGEREMSVQDALSRSAEQVGPVLLWIGITGGGLMAALFIYPAIVSEETMGAALGLVFFGACAGFLILVHRARRRS